MRRLFRAHEVQPYPSISPLATPAVSSREFAVPAQMWGNLTAHFPIGGFASQSRCPSAHLKRGRPEIAIRVHRIASESQRSLPGVLGWDVGCVACQHQAFRKHIIRHQPVTVALLFLCADWVLD